MKRFVIGLRILLVLTVVAAVGWYGYGWWQSEGGGASILKNTLYPRAGNILLQDGVISFGKDQVLAASKQNYKELAPQPRFGVTKRVIRYISYDMNGQEIKVYARVYLPIGDSGKAPLLAFAPGTTGIGDQCAASLEQPAKSNWANYDSHMLTYAGQGFAAVTTDYEGMRDDTRIHHYMVGELEGRALLDAARAAKKLAGADVDDQRVVLAGFSQGGHSAFWADKIASQYAPELAIKGVIGFGPVTDVERTMADAANGANIAWFGPFVLASYADYYQHSYNLNTILQPKWIPNLKSEVSAHCIDTVSGHWGKNAAEVYTPDFLAALKTATLANAGYSQLNSDLKRNTTINASTRTPKLIAQGQQDNVILPAQQIDLLPEMCRSARGPIRLSLYPAATHYTVMPQSLQDTLRWIGDVTSGKAVLSSCS